jgi:DNA-binding NarL/FixJ family response regulator
MLPREPLDVSARRLVISGTVSDQQGLAVTAAAAARGAGVVAQCADSNVATAMEATLGKFGPVRRELDITAEHGGLTREQQALLARLAAGESVAVAAEAEFLSLRTANRRLAQARERLNVVTTDQAVQAYVALVDASQH